MNENVKETKDVKNVQKNVVVNEEDYRILPKQAKPLTLNLLCSKYRPKGTHKDIVNYSAVLTIKAPAEYGAMANIDLNIRLTNDEYINILLELDLLRSAGSDSISLSCSNYAFFKGEYLDKFGNDSIYYNVTVQISPSFKRAFFCNKFQIVRLEKFGYNEKFILRANKLVETEETGLGNAFE